MVVGGLIGLVVVCSWSWNELSKRRARHLKRLEKAAFSAWCAEAFRQGVTDHHFVPGPDADRAIDELRDDDPSRRHARAANPWWRYGYLLTTLERGVWSETEERLLRETIAAVREGIPSWESRAAEVGYHRDRIRPIPPLVCRGPQDERRPVSARPRTRS